MPLQPTLDTEIETLKQAITAEREHTSRSEYIATVQPMKDELKSLIEQNEIIKAENKAFTESMPPTPEELDKRRKADIANEIALKYTLADEISMNRKLITGESELTDTDIIEWFNDVASAKAKYPKV